MHTPEVIHELHDNEIFVFGSNAAGQHMGGAARFAHDTFGAEWGVGEGPTGQCYAIPTMGTALELSLAVQQFLYYASTHGQQMFLVTPIGTGIAGLKAEDVAPLFADAAPNVILPLAFKAVLA